MAHWTKVHVQLRRGPLSAGADDQQKRTIVFEIEIPLQIRTRVRPAYVRGTDALGANLHAMAGAPEASRHQQPAAAAGRRDCESGSRRGREIIEERGSRYGPAVEGG